MIDKTNELMDYMEVNKIVSECEKWQVNHDEKKRKRKIVYRHWISRRLLFVNLIVSRDI